jgi:hypothetical protein
MPPSLRSSPKKRTTTPDSPSPSSSSKSKGKSPRSVAAKEIPPKAPARSSPSSPSRAIAQPQSPARAALASPAQSSSSRSQEEIKLRRQTKALRLAREALRQLECVEKQAEAARAAIAGQRLAHHALRDYRTRANQQLRGLIHKTSSLEDLEPEVPGRSSPPAKIPASLGELPLPPAAEASDLDLKKFSEEDFAAPPGVSSRASRAANSPLAKRPKKQ